MPTIVDGKKIAGEILQDLVTRVKILKEKNIQPALAVILVGNDKPSHTYVGKKGQAAQKIGVSFFKFELPEDISQAELIEQIKKIQTENKLSGLIVQLPLPEHLRSATRMIVDNINDEIDVDCLTFTALGKILMGQNQLMPPTPGAILEILKYHKVDLTGKEVCLVGKGNLIGKPLAGLLLNEKCTLTVCSKHTLDLSSHTKKADIVITGVGKKDLLTGEMIKEGAVVVDAGVCFEDGKMYGDINFDSVATKASLIVPTPGGVGPITVAKLLENTVIVAESLI